MGICQSAPSHVEEDEQEALITVPFFTKLSKSEIEALREAFERKEIKKGQVIVPRGSKRPTFGVIVRGSCVLTAPSAKSGSGASGSGFAGSSSDSSLGSGPVESDGDGDEGGAEVELRRLSPGEFYGDLASSGSDYKSSLTLRAAEDTTVLISEPAKLAVILQKHPNLGTAVASVGGKPISLQLQSIPLFAEADISNLQQLAALCSLRKYPERKLVCEEGQKADGFYYILEGTVQVSVMDEKKEVFLNTLTKGEWFGEIALLQETNRTATVRTVQECILLTLSKEKFDKFLTIAPGIRESEAFSNLVKKRTGNHLRAIPIFNSLKQKQVGALERFDEHKLDMLGELFHWVQCDPGHVVYQEGTASEAFYIIIKGTVRMEVSSSEKKDSKVILCRLGVHDWFGELSLLQSGPEASKCTSTIVVEEPSLLLKLLGEDFKKFQRICPEVGNAVRARLGVRTAQRLRQIPFFSSIKENRPWSKLDLLGDLFEFELMETGHIVFREGEPGQKFYLIVSGTVSVTINRPGESVLHIVDQTDGHWFGEIALMRDTPRTATVTCTTDCVFVTITSEKFQRFLDVAPELTEPFQLMLDLRTARMLKQIPLFKDVKENKPWSILEMIGSLFSYLHMDRDFYVYRTGDDADELYIIIKGKVKVEEKGKESEIGEHDTFGSTEAFEGMPRSGSAITLTPCLFATISREYFPRLFQLAPTIIKGFKEDHQAIRSSLASIRTHAASVTRQKRSLVQKRTGRKSQLGDDFSLAHSSSSSRLSSSSSAAAADFKFRISIEGPDGDKKDGGGGRDSEIGEGGEGEEGGRDSASSSSSSSSMEPRLSSIPLIREADGLEVVHVVLRGDGSVEPSQGVPIPDIE